MYKQKLIELLKEVPEIKNDLEENTIEERHLRMYFVAKWINFMQYCNWVINSFKINPRWYSISEIEITKIDNWKSFDMQSENVYKEIYNYLTK